MPTIIKNYPDSTTWPQRAEEISLEDAEEMVKAGEADKDEHGIYIERAATSATYKTKTMEAQSPKDADVDADADADDKPKKRGRPRKSANGDN